MTTLICFWYNQQSFDKIIRIKLMMIMMNCFVVWLTGERRLTLFPAGTNVRDPHHRKSPTRREQDLDLRRI